MRNRFCLLLSAIAFLSITQSTQAQISVDGSTATQVNGNAIAPTGAGTINGNNLYHSFSEFNVPQSGVIFNTGNSAVNGADVRNIINRVTGDNPSAILGTLESRQAFPNANLYLMNPNGIVFGQNARLDIGGSFHATTGNGLGFDSGTFSVDKNSLSFPNGDPKTIRFAIAQPAGIINQGNLSVDTGKSITFTGGSIINTGTLTAPSGNIALTAVAGNSQVELRSPDVVLGLQVTNNAIPTNWSGKITELPKLAELLTGKVPEANQVVVKADGSLALVASPAANDITVTNGMSVISGRVDVSSSDSKAGNVGIFGEKVGLVSAQIDASGALGGGTVLIGGNLQGNGISPNALKTFVNSSSKIDVSAILRGNAGTVIVWADLNTRFLGSIIAKGGNQSGDGGFVEVSGKQNLDYRGNVNTLAPNGKIGTLLLDPTNITVINGPGSFTSLTDVDDVLDPDITANTIDVSLINNAIANVSLQATNNIKFDAPVNMTNSNIGLTANAGNNIDIDAPIETQNGAIIFTAGNNINFNNASIKTNGGALSFTATSNNILGNNGNISTSSNTVNAGSVNLTASSGNITFGKIEATSTVASGGDVNISAGNNIKSTGSPNSIVTDSFATTGDAGNITISSTSGRIDIDSGTVRAVASNGLGGGKIELEAQKSINAGALISKSPSFSGTGGKIILNSTTQNIVFTYADSSGGFQGGDFTATSPNGNIQAFWFNSESGACFGSSICTAGGSGGLLNISHDGLKPFIIGDSSKNGTLGNVTTGTFTLTPFKIIPKGVGTFTLGNIAISPSSGGGVELLEAPNNQNNQNNQNDQNNPNNQNSNVRKLSNEVEQKLLGISTVLKKQVDRFLKEEKLDKAFEAIEKAYISELGIFLGETLKLPTLTINQAQDILSDVSKRSGSPSVLIYPIMLNDRIEIIVIPPKELGKPFHRYTNYASEEEIITVLNDYRASLRDTSSLDYLEQAQKLYDWVMRPIDAQLQSLKIETVVFVMDSGLRVIPPASLHDGKQFLVERYASANIPSLRVTRLEERDRKNTRVLAMGLTEAREGLSALPAVEVEIRTIANQVLSGTTFLDRDFTVNNLQAQRGKAKYGIIHLGTHGKFLQDRSNESFVQFWDGKLRSSQIPSLRFDQPVIDMLTLSACETAVGNNLGISGLAVESGARSILASLWTVSDAGTAPLMISFYKAFPDALSKATALRKAQLDLIKGKVKIVNNQIVGVEGLAAIALPKGTGNIDISHPFFWSSFILVGNWL
jgi:filamentous hemagglutinin family protein